MKKLLFFALLIAAGYKGYTDFFKNDADTFDAEGNPQVLLFTVSGCGRWSPRQTRQSKVGLGTENPCRPA